MSQQWGIFNDEAADYTEDEAVVAGFYSKEEADNYLAESFTDEDECFVHLCEEPDDEDDPDLKDDEDDEDDEDDGWQYPTKY